MVTPKNTSDLDRLQWVNNWHLPKGLTIRDQPTIELEHKLWTDGWQVHLCALAFAHFTFAPCESNCGLCNRAVNILSNYGFAACNILWTNYILTVWTAAETVLWVFVYFVRWLERAWASLHWVKSPIGQSASCGLGFANCRLSFLSTTAAVDTKLNAWLLYPRRLRKGADRAPPSICCPHSATNNPQTSKFPPALRHPGLGPSSPAVPTPAFHPVPPRPV